MKLVIISHTEHYKSVDGTIVGWGATVTEINQLAKYFDEIYHVAFLYSNNPPSSALPYSASNIHFIPLEPVGGNSFSKKVKVIFSIPRIIKTIENTLKKVDVFQLRTPTGMGVFLIPWFTVFPHKKGWYKYAGNWVQKKPPFGYAIQRWLLRHQNRPVTVNGNWKDDEKQIIPFENPCLTSKDREVGKDIVKSKRYVRHKKYCFVGGLNDNKGILLVLQAFEEKICDEFAELHIVGDGPLKKTVGLKSLTMDTKIIVHGSLSRTAVHDIYKECHFLILPSKSEGFPKVIGEAMNFGCIPIVSNISCIDQYIVDEINGFLLEASTVGAIKKAIQRSCQVSEEKFNDMIRLNYKLAEKFTYSYYIERIQNDIFKNL